MLRTLASLIGLTAVFAATPLRAADPAPYFPPPDSEGSWRALHAPAEIRRLAGMDAERLKRAYQLTGRGTRNGGLLVMPHANGAGSIALHATDALRIGCCLLHDGKWKDQDLEPADYIAPCHQPSPWNPHTPFSLQFEHNSDGHVAGAPRDAFYKSGAGGFGLFVVPSLDVVIDKLGGSNGQYGPSLTGLPQPEQSAARDEWKPIPGSPFHEGSQGGDDTLRHVMELVTAAVVE